MDAFQHKTLVTEPFGLTYSYYLSPGFHDKAAKNLPTLMFTHGFPDDAYMWEKALPTLSKQPYPILLAEILGLGDSSKPTEVDRYNYGHQANSLAQILDKEGVRSNVIPVGHDWGSATAQRFYLFHKDRCAGLCLLALAYTPPSEEPFDLSTVNAATAKEFGYPQWEYWYFFTAPDAPKILKENIARFWDVNNGQLFDEQGREVWMREMFCKKDAMRNYLIAAGPYRDFTVELRPYARDEKLRRRFVDRLGSAGLEGAVNYYHGLKSNAMKDEERPLAASKERMTISHPCLYIGFEDDWVCRTDQMKVAKQQGLTTDLKEVAVKAGHWSMYDQETATNVAGHLSEWLKEKFPVKE